MSKIASDQFKKYIDLPQNNPYIFTQVHLLPIVLGKKPSYTIDIFCFRKKNEKIMLTFNHVDKVYFKVKINGNLPTAVK